MQKSILSGMVFLSFLFTFFFFYSAVHAAEVYMPHITGGYPEWVDYLQVNNGDAEAHDFTVTLYSEGSEVYSGAHTVAGYGHEQIEIKSLDSTADSGEIVYTSDALMFRVSYAYTATGGVAEFALSDTVSSAMGLLYSGFVSSVNYKGAAIANMSDTPAYVTLYAMGDGSIIDTYSATLGAREKILGNHEAWFPTVAFADIESIVAVSTEPVLSGLVICTDADLSYLLFTPGRDVPSFDTTGAPDVASWAFTAGGSEADEKGRHVCQTPDGGFVVAGVSASYGEGNNDMWILKLTASGSIDWQKTYGGPSNDMVESICTTADGGYVMAGHTGSFGSGVYDLWVLKLDSDGNCEWQKAYGGSDSDMGYSLRPTSDGGYVITGRTYSYGAGGSDLWVLKLNSTGGVDWQKTYGGVYGDYGESIRQTSDGGYIVAGSTRSAGAGETDIWVLKLDESGVVDWQKTYGGSSYDRAYSVCEASDGGFVVAGQTYSFGAGNFDLWALKLDGSGDIEWEKTYGGTDYEEGTSVSRTIDGGYIVTGYTASAGAGETDIWALKLNGSGGVDWQKICGGSDNDVGFGLCETTAGGYVVTGETYSYGAGESDLWALRLDSSGDLPGCSGISLTDTALSSADSACTPADSSVFASSSPAAVETTAVAGSLTDAEVTFQCPD